MPQRNNYRGRKNSNEDDFSFEIVHHYGVLSTTSRGWNKEFNYVIWNNRDPKFDIREWQPDHAKMSKGVTLTVNEVAELYQMLNDNAGDFDPEDPEEYSGGLLDQAV